MNTPHFTWHGAAEGPYLRQLTLIETTSKKQIASLRATLTEFYSRTMLCEIKYKRFLFRVIAGVLIYLFRETSNT